MYKYRILKKRIYSNKTDRVVFSRSKRHIFLENNNYNFTSHRQLTFCVNRREYFVKSKPERRGRAVKKVQRKIRSHLNDRLTMAVRFLSGARPAFRCNTVSTIREQDRKGPINFPKSVQNYIFQVF